MARPSAGAHVRLTRSGRIAPSAHGPIHLARHIDATIGGGRRAGRARGRARSRSRSGRWPRTGGAGLPPETRTGVRWRGHARGLGRAGPRSRGRAGRERCRHRGARRGGHRSSWCHAHTGAHRRALTRPAAPVRRDVVERSGAARAGGAARGARRESPARHAGGRLHHPARPRHRGRRLRGRGIASGPRAGHRDWAAPHRGQSRDRGDRHLCAERLLAGVGGATGRRRGRRPFADSDGARPGGSRRRLDQGLRRLPRGPARRNSRDVLAGRV